MWQKATPWIARQPMQTPSYFRHKDSRICYTECLGFPNKQNAHFREVSDNSDHGRAACSQRAVDFAQRYG